MKGQLGKSIYTIIPECVLERFGDESMMTCMSCHQIDVTFDFMYENFIGQKLHLFGGRGHIKRQNLNDMSYFLQKYHTKKG